MPRLLIEFAHPALEKSRVHRALIAVAARRTDVTVNDLYQRYPDADLDVAREQALLGEHDVVMLQFPMYWYSTPPILKLWQDLVLEHGWAYGRRGHALAGKLLGCAITAGGPEEAYRPGGFNEAPIRQYLLPLESTTRLCRMTWLPPWIVHGTHRLDSTGIDAAAREYNALLAALTAGQVDPGRVADADQLVPSHWQRRG
jgi:glutathione-regulated potassium-efflux system ancillary protein KefG